MNSTRMLNTCKVLLICFVGLGITSCFLHTSSTRQGCKEFPDHEWCQDNSWKL